MAEYEPGKMDITEQEKTYAGFVAFTKWGTIACLVILLFLAAVNG